MPCGIVEVLRTVNFASRRQCIRHTCVNNETRNPKLGQGSIYHNEIASSQKYLERTMLQALRTPTNNQHTSLDCPTQS